MRTLEELYPLAWVPDSDRTIACHLQGLSREVVRIWGKGTLEGAIEIHMAGPPYFECKGRLRCGDKISTEVLAGGTTPASAWRNAKLFVLRKALFKNREIPALGRILENEFSVVDLEFFRGEPEISLGQGLYQVRLKFNKGNPPWLRASSLLRSEYMLDADLLPHVEGKRTRYLRLSRVPDELRKAIAPLMRSDKDIFLHRLVMALDGIQIGGDIGQGSSLHVHHINGNGLDCRKVNLQALSPERHQALHSTWKENFEGPSSETRRQTGSIYIHHLPPCFLHTHGLLEIEGDDISDMVTNPLKMQNSEDALNPGRPFHPNTEKGGAAPVTRPEIAALAERSDRARSMEKALLALDECGGQGFIRDIKLVRSAKGLSGSTLNRALVALEHAGIVRTAKIGRGYPDHYRLARKIEL